MKKLLLVLFLFLPITVFAFPHPDMDAVYNHYYNQCTQNVHDSALCHCVGYCMAHTRDGELPRLEQEWLNDCYNNCQDIKYRNF